MLNMSEEWRTDYLKPLQCGTQDGEWMPAFVGCWSDAHSHGLHVWERWPFGITSSPKHFQKQMQAELPALSTWWTMCIFSKVHWRSNQDLQNMLECLKAAGTTLSHKKCVWCQKACIPQTCHWQARGQTWLKEAASDPVSWSPEECIRCALHP